MSPTAVQPAVTYKFLENQNIYTKLLYDYKKNKK